MQSDLKTFNNGSGCNVLLAEDDSDSQMLLAHILKQAGATVTTANNGKECLEKALSALKQSAPFDLILMDVQMPELDGTQATRELRKHGYDLPIVAMTARSTPSDKEETIKAGCNAHVSKLAGKDTLVSTLLTQLQTRSRPPSSEIPVLPFIPETIHTNPEYANSILALLDRLPQTIAKIEEATTAHDYQAVKAATLELGSLSLYGYTILAGFLKEVQLLAETREGAKLRRLLPQLQRSVKAVLAGRVQIEKIAVSLEQLDT